MSRTAAVRVIMILVIAASRVAVAANKYQLQQDAQAVAIARAAFTAMGGAQAVAGYQDSEATGTATISTGGGPVSYPITLKSKGLRETRIEIQMAKGTNVRIMNQGQAVIQRPDGTVKSLYSNNTFSEHVEYVPLLSVLAEIANGNVNLIYRGTGRIQGQAEDIIELDFVPNLDPIQGPLLASMSRTLYFVNRATQLVDKIQSTPFNEGDKENTFTEEVFLTNYQSVNGLLVPFQETVFIDGKLDTNITLTTFNLNVGLSDSEFSLPQAR